MSDAAVSQGAAPFESASELREAHRRLLEAFDRQLGPDGSEADEVDALRSIEGQIRQFLERGAATGVYLEEIKDRTDCQVLLDYWVSSLSRAGLQVSGARLAKFDGGQLPDLKDKPCPYVGLEAFGARLSSSAGRPTRRRRSRKFAPRRLSSCSEPRAAASRPW